MSKPLTARMAQALREGRPLAVLAEIDHPDGVARFWTGVGPLAWNGVTWTGIGALGSVAPVRQQSEISIQEIVFTLSGVDADVLARLDDNVRNRVASLWLAAFGELGEVIDAPYRLLDALLDFQTLATGDDGASAISITARSGFYSLERGLDEAWTPETQKLRFPDDTGLDMIPSLQNQDIQWTPT